MVFLLAGVLLLTAWRFAVEGRRQGLRRVFKSILVAAACGLLAGVFIGVGARVGMGAITVANGDPMRLTLSGSFSVVATFSSFGIVLGIVYEGLFRRLLRRNGLAYGLLLTLCLWYPLAHAAAQQLNEPRALIPLAIISGCLVALMWMPFGASLEALLRRWQNGGTARASAGAA